MSFPLSSTLARRLITDPVMAAKVLMGADLDRFQRARLRTWWQCPNVLDHSGVSTGKTQLVIIFAFLRLLLLPLSGKSGPRIVAVYLPSLGIAESELLPRIANYMKSQEGVLAKQIRRQHGGGFFSKKLNTIWIESRDGGRIEFPAGNFMKDSENNVSRRFNDLICDETPVMDLQGQGIDKQLNQRATKECFNPDHPIHANHRIYLGHAESPDHPYHKRLLSFKSAISKGSQGHVIFTSSYKDYSGEHKRSYGSEVARQAELDAVRMDAAEHAQIYYGLWKRGSKGLYSESMRRAITRPDLRPHLRRIDPSTTYFLGWDTATGTTSGGASSANDWSAGVVTAATPIPSIPGPDPGYIQIEDRFFHLRTAMAVFLPPGADVDQKSGLIHLLHLLFNFAGLALDNRGGGGEVAMKLRESRQLVHNEWKQTTGLCRPLEAFAWPLADPIVHFFDRGDNLFRPWFGERFVTDNSGPIDYAHREIRGMMRRGELAWPAGSADLTPAAINALPADEHNALLDLEKCLSEFGNISVRIDKNGAPIVSEKGFQKFTHTRKKDGAMAAIYSTLGIRAHLARQFSTSTRTSTDTCMGVY